MNKLMTVVAASVCAVSLSGSAIAAEDSSTENKEIELQEEEDQLFEAGLDVDLNSAYIWRNVVQTDKLVFQPCVWADFVGLDPFWFGFYYWQNWDLSSDRFDLFHRRFNESDYNIHVGATAWENEDGDMSLEFELGHEWYTYHFDRREDGCSLSPSTREFYLNGKFKNPVVNVLAQFGGMYDDISCYDSGFYYELGFNKEFALCDELTLGFDWGITLGDADYLYFIYDEDVKEGFAGTTAKAYLTWSITEWMSLRGSIAYTGTMNSDARDAQSSDDKDILWGGFRLSFSY